jgi:hypothetical protein
VFGGDVALVERVATTFGDQPQGPGECGLFEYFAGLRARPLTSRQRDAPSSALSISTESPHAWAPAGETGKPSTA